MLASASRNIPLPLSESHQQGTGLGTIITFAQFAIFYKDFLNCFETYPALRAPLSERGGCRITTIFATIGYIVNSMVFLTRGYIEGEADAVVSRLVPRQSVSHGCRGCFLAYPAIS